MEKFRQLQTGAAMMPQKVINKNILMSVGTEFLQTVIRRLKFYKDLGDKTFEQLTTEQMHYAPNAESNSIAVIVQHMSGNMLSRWTHFLTEDGEKSWRQRDDEFEIHDHSREKIIDIWEKGWDCFLNTLQALTEDDLMKQVSIRQEPLTVIDAINRQLAHYPYHIGQIIFLGKMMKSGEWKNLSIPKGKSGDYNASSGVKDPAKKH